MQFKYWTVRVTPDAMRIGSIGVGIIVIAPEYGFAQAKMIASVEDIPRSFHARLQTFEWLTGLENRINGIDDHPRLELDYRASLDAYVSRLARQMNNAIRIDAPRYAAGASIEEMVNLLFTKLIGAEGREKKKRRLTVVREDVRAAYEAKSIIQRNLHSKPELCIGSRSTQLDLAVVEESRGRVFELNSAFTFAGQPQKSVKDKVDAWTWRIEKLRHEGGRLTLPNNSEIELHDKAPVIAVIQPPESQLQRELYEEATAEWDALDIEQVLDDRIAAHADSLERMLRAG